MQRLVLESRFSSLRNEKKKMGKLQSGCCERFYITKNNNINERVINFGEIGSKFYSLGPNSRCREII